MPIGNSKKTRYGYVYETIFTHPQTGIEYHYIGQHLGQDIDYDYFGSGFILTKMLRKHCREKHLLEQCVKRFLLMWAYDRNELNFKEIMCISFAKLIYGRQCINLDYTGRVGGRSARSKRLTSQKLKGRLCPWVRETHLGRKKSEETKRKISEALSGKKKKPLTDEQKANLSVWNAGKILSEEHKTKIAQARLGKPAGPQRTLTCDVCGLTGGITNLTRFHFQHCRRRARAGQG